MFCKRIVSLALILLPAWAAAVVGLPASAQTVLFEGARAIAGDGSPAVENAASQRGKAEFLAQSCINCHRVRGTVAQGGYAPDLTHLMGRQTLASGIVLNTTENIRRWVDNPASIKPGCLMPAFGLSERDRRLMVDYLTTLR